jgi:hypothetical protein
MVQPLVLQEVHLVLPLLFLVGEILAAADFITVLHMELAEAAAQELRVEMLLVLLLLVLVVQVLVFQYLVRLLVMQAAAPEVMLILQEIQVQAQQIQVVQQLLAVQ